MKNPIQVKYEDLEQSKVKYVATPIQIARIMDYCLGMTVHGRQGLRVILPKVLTAIDGINGIYYGEKIKLEKFPQSLKDEHKEGKNGLN
jgi:hypothetical protein